MNELLIYSDIGDSYWYDSVSAKDIKTQLDAMDDGELTVRINSPGGSVFDGFSIYNLLAQRSGKVTVYIDGMAASAASVVAMAGDEILMADNALMMIHDPWTMMMGSADEMRDTADLLDKIKGSIVTTYQAKSELDAEKIGAMMTEETWLTAQEAIDNGFATGTVEIAAKAMNIKKPWINHAPESVENIVASIDESIAAKLAKMKKGASQLAFDNHRQLLRN